MKELWNPRHFLLQCQDPQVKGRRGRVEGIGRRDRLNPREILGIPSFSSLNSFCLYHIPQAILPVREVESFPGCLNAGGRGNLISSVTGSWRLGASCSWQGGTHTHFAHLCTTAANIMPT